MKLIPLLNSNTAFALIDACQADVVSGYRWRLSTHGYAITTGYIDGRQTSLLMHRLLMNASPELSVDHVNHDPLDNRLANLRLCTHAENMQNRKTHRNNRLGVKGVYLDSRRKRFSAQIRVDGKKINLGTFDAIEDARLAYVEASKKYHGEFACSGT